MDDPVLDGDHHEAALRGLSRLNYLSGSARTIWPSLAALAGQLDRQQLRKGGKRPLAFPARPRMIAAVEELRPE